MRWLNRSPRQERRRLGDGFPSGGERGGIVSFGVLCDEEAFHAVASLVSLLG